MPHNPQEYDSATDIPIIRVDWREEAAIFVVLVGALFAVGWIGYKLARVMGACS